MKQHCVTSSFYRTYLLRKGHLLFFICFLYLLSCNNINRNSSHKTTSVSSIIKGKSLAASYCQSCHMLPDPSWVDSKTWENGVLPAMGPRLGIFYYGLKTYPSYKYDRDLPQGFYPEKPVISYEEWQSIIDYYTANSPDSISTDQHRDHSIKNKLLQFTPAVPAFHYHIPATLLVKIDTQSNAKPVIIADANRKKIYEFDKSLKLIDSIQTTGPIVDIELQQKQWIACNIGVLNPNNGHYGKVESMDVSESKNIKDSVLFSELARPVQVVTTDLNNDGINDYLVCEFGFLKGSLIWMETKKNGTFERHVLRDYPGAIKAYVNDYNKDGLKDIWVLFAQGEEGVFLFTNKGNGNFKQEEVLRFPPIYGSSSFELTDFNQDGYNDIVYTCGDNADASPVLKPFHGVYIFLNNGKNHFTQKYFFPVNGCYKAIARDYDGDGDIDIATIAYFADYQRQPEEGFIYLENKGNYNFMPYTLPETQQGRWLTMDANDINKDDRIDLILGNFASAPSFINSKIDWKNSPPFMVLINNGKNY